MSAAFRVGDRVRVPFGRRKVPAVVSEDRGAIGVHGRRLYQVLVYMDPFEPEPFELPEDEIEPLDESAERSVGLDRAKVKAYLVHGGLIDILRSTLPGGRGQSRVWLRPDSLGNVTHTYQEERGVVGGEVVPFMAVHGERIFTPKKGEVLSLLRSFHLDQRDAERIVASVGTAP